MGGHMSDIVDLTDSLEEQLVSPYGGGPFRLKGCLYLLEKNPASPLYFARLIPLTPPYRSQHWSGVRAAAKRFADSRLATEYGKFLDSLADRKPGDSVVIAVQEPNPMPLRPRVVENEVRMTALEYLTTYTGVHHKQVSRSQHETRDRE